MPASPATRRDDQILDEEGFSKLVRVAERTDILNIGLDWGGWGYDLLAEGQVARIVDAFPRLQMKQRFIRDLCRRNAGRHH